MKNDFDTITCADKEDAKMIVDSLGAQYIRDWEFLPKGKVKLILNGRLEDIENDRQRIARY